MSTIKKPQEGQELIKEKTDFTSLILPILLLAFFVTIIIVAMNNTQTKPEDQTVVEETNQTQTSTSANEVEIQDLVVGEGQELKSGDNATFHYTGTLKEGGKKFDSSLDRNQPFTTQIGVGQVIPGWDQGIPGMKIGGKRILTIPYQLAYGEEGAGNDIPPRSDLVFEVELLAIE